MCRGAVYMFTALITAQDTEKAADGATCATQALAAARGHKKPAAGKSVGPRIEGGSGVEVDTLQPLHGAL